MQAMAAVEGFSIKGSRAQRNNNPGNLDFVSWMAAYGAKLETIPHGFNEAPRFAAFPSPEQGWDAMRALLSDDYCGLSVTEALNKWAPPVENQTNVYIATVCKLTGLAPDATLTTELLE